MRVKVIGWSFQTKIFRVGTFPRALSIYKWCLGEMPAKSTYIKEFGYHYCVDFFFKLKLLPILSCFSLW